MERGDTGLGRDAYGLPRRERDRRGYGPYSPDDHYSSPDGYEEDDAAGPGRPVDAEEDDYGQLLRRPGEMPPRQRLRQPGRPLPGPPGRYPPGAPPNGGPGHNGGLGHGGGPGPGGPQGSMPYAGPPNGAPHAAPPNGAPHAGPPNGGAPHAGPHPGPPNGGPPGRQYRLPNGRRVPSNPDRLYRPPGPSMPGGTSGRHHGPGPAAPDPYAAGWSRPGPAPGAPPPGGHGPGAAGGHGPGSAVPGNVIPGNVIPGGAGGHGPGGAIPGGAGGHGPGGAIPGGVIPGGAPPYGGHGRERLGPPPEPPGPVIRQREAAVPEQPGGAAQPVASIAPDGLEAFARDLRALRAKADLDYPEMAEVSHYEMKTLAAAAGGLRLPTLPVAVAFVRACDGNVAEWEERWQKLAEKLTAEASKKRRDEDGDDTGPVEPAEAPAALEGPGGKPGTAPPDSDGGEVYVITSAKPRQPGW